MNKAARPRPYVHQTWPAGALMPIASGYAIDASFVAEANRPASSSAIISWIDVQARVGNGDLLVELRRAHDTPAARDLDCGLAASDQDQCRHFAEARRTRARGVVRVGRGDGLECIERAPAHRQRHGLIHHQLDRGCQDCVFSASAAS